MFLFYFFTFYAPSKTLRFISAVYSLIGKTGVIQATIRCVTSTNVCRISRYSWGSGKQNLVLNFIPVPFLPSDSYSFRELSGVSPECSLSVIRRGVYAHHNDDRSPANRVIRAADILEMSTIDIANVQETYCWGQNYVYSTWLQQQQKKPLKSREGYRIMHLSWYFSMLFTEYVTLVAHLMDIEVVRTQDV